MEDPAVVANRLTQTAKGIIDEARALGRDAITESADVDTYTAAKFVDTVTRSVDLAVKGGMALTRDVLDQPVPSTPDPDAEGRRQVADVMETIGRRMIRQAGAVARETATELDSNTPTPTLWVRSMVKLANISLLGSIELAETALIGPAKYETNVLLSENFSAPGAGARELVLASPPGLTRPGTSDPIPAGLVGFYNAGPGAAAVLSGNKLAAGVTTFRIGVDPRPLISGMYVGQVEVRDAATKAVIQTVTVEIAI